MTSIDYNEIYQRFYTKVEAYDFLNLDEYTVNDFLCNWLHSSLSEPYIRQLFSSVVFDDDIMRLSYEMTNVHNEEMDKDFVIEILALGIAIKWMEPKVKSVLNTSNFYGSKEERTYSPASHLKQLQDTFSVMKKEQRRMIADRGYIKNAYTDGDIPLVKES
jgi:hypothetical protein